MNTKFRIRQYGKSEFAWLLFPQAQSPDAAQTRLLRWIKKDKCLHKRLLRLASSKNDNTYSIKQVRLLIDKFGEPGEYDDY